MAHARDRKLDARQDADISLTPFLLTYLNDPELRRTIHTATNKSEQFND
jgi:TnpA family transposase